MAGPVSLVGGSRIASFLATRPILAADAEDAAHAALGAALVVCSHYLCAKLVRIGTNTGVISAALAASSTEVLLLAAGGLAVARKSWAATVKTKDCLSDYASSVPETF